MKLFVRHVQQFSRWGFENPISRSATKPWVLTVEHFRLENSKEFEQSCRRGEDAAANVGVHILEMLYD